VSLLGCHDVCPKNLPLQTQIAYLRRAMMKQDFGKGSGNELKSIPIVKAPTARSVPAATAPQPRQEV
jgi:L-lactate utilization protein LutB